MLLMSLGLGFLNGVRKTTKPTLLKMRTSLLLGLCAIWTSCSMPHREEVSFRDADGKPLDDRGVIKAIDAGKQKLGNSGRLVIRPSGTEPVIRVMAEGDDQDLVSSVVGDIAEAVRVAADAT